MILIAYFVLFLIFIFVIFYIITFLTGGWYAPLSSKIIDQMLKLAKVTNKDYLIDLGSGDGRVLITASKLRIPSLGFEINPFLYYLSKLRFHLIKTSPKPKVQFSNFWYQDLSEATVITIFLAPLSQKALENKLLKELKSGTRVITYGLWFPNWKVTRQTTNGIFLYIKD